MEYSAERRAPYALSNPCDLYRCHIDSPCVAENAKTLCIVKSAVLQGKRSTSLHLLPRNHLLDSLRHGFGLFVVHKESGGSLWVRTSALCSGGRMILMPSRRQWQQEKPGMGTSSSACVQCCCNRKKNLVLS